MKNEVKFNVLWLDDEPMELLDKYGIHEDFENKLNIDKVAYTDECMEILNNPHNYQVVILDAQGKSRKHITEDASLENFFTLVNMALKQKLAVYVYSGEINKDNKSYDDVEDRLKEKGIYKYDTYFQKPGLYDLFEKIVSDLEEGYQLLQQEPELLENIISYNIDKECILKILKWKEDQSQEFPDYLSLRKLVVDHIQKKELNPFLGIAGDPDLKCCTELLFTQDELEVLLQFKRICNADLHSKIKNAQLDNYYNAIIANSFLYIMRWYNRWRHNIETDSDVHAYYTKAQSDENHIVNAGQNKKFDIPKNDTIDIVKKDDWGNYKASGCLLNVNQGEQYLGKKVLIEKSINKQLAIKIKLME